MAESTVAPTMRAAVYRGPGELAIETRPVPQLGHDDVLIEISHCGVCGTDLHLVLEGMGAPGSIGGHEYSGEIAAVGDRVESWAPGDRVVGSGEPGCGACVSCRAGRPSVCVERAAFGAVEFQGAFAEFMRVAADELVRIPDGLPLRVAALAEPLAVALHAISVSRAQATDRVLVSGAGPLGLLVIAALRARGIDRVRVCEPAPRRAAQALEAGAVTACAPEDLATPPMPFVLVDDPVDVVIECSGNPKAMQSGLAQLDRLGTLVLVGTGMRRPKLDHNRVLMNELVVTGAYNYDANGFERALELLASGALPIERLIDPVDASLENLFEALEALARGERAAKVMVVPGVSTA